MGLLAKYEKAQQASQKSSRTFFIYPYNLKKRKERENGFNNQKYSSESNINEIVLLEQIRRKNDNDNLPSHMNIKVLH